MKLRLGSLLVGCLLVVGAGYRLDDASDWKAIAGDWQPTKMEINGNALPAEDVKEFLITMKDGTYSAKRGDEVIDEGKAKIDASKNPKHLELTASVGDAKDKVRLGIYEVKDDTLKFAIASPDKERPTKFESPADSGTIYIEFTRKKK
jgi:uncharacterized protein (TIGR03067 family)